ncbi:hypothetical protein A0256_14225 [Mucilaginibacter sp. PAMC 26640]|nr:hypothetical protein A0256_14225 [Mucilaginibacter sp. PAMC 26640]
MARLFAKPEYTFIFFYKGNTLITLLIVVFQLIAFVDIPDKIFEYVHGITLGNWMPCEIAI